MRGVLFSAESLFTGADPLHWSRIGDFFLAARKIL
jgi:hypothetical protein